MDNCGLCFSYGVQTIATTMNNDKIKICFECMERKSNAHA